jgi:two-component system LytT family response regulator
MNSDKKTTVVIVDDATQARELLRLMLNELIPNIEILGEAENAEQAYELIQTTKPDAIFLDIKMPGKSGLELFEEFANESMDYNVVFTTAYNEYAIQAFRLSAIDYLLKPIQENQLIEAVKKINLSKKLKQDSNKLSALITNLNQKNNGTLAIPISSGHEYLMIKDIEFLEAERAYSIIHLADGSQKLVSKNLGYFEEVLQHLDLFIKTHRSFFVNTNYISSFHKKAEAGTITFKSGKTAEVSRHSRKAFMDKFETLGI